MVTNERMVVDIFDMNNKDLRPRGVSLGLKKLKPPKRGSKKRCS